MTAWRRNQTPSLPPDSSAQSSRAERRIAPGASHLLGPEHILLTTDNGDFDCLGTIDSDKTFEDLLPLSRAMTLDEAELLVLDLPTLIEVERRAGRPKDLAVLPVLEATLDERNRS